ncbi:MAG: phosphoadenosine phosphosulfate reductase [Gammaproteobacteria bacterium]|nr:MAG: phosphoadenosine phosphosulfate reductase [Gammaproteobacteria bacterium]
MTKLNPINSSEDKSITRGFLWNANQQLAKLSAEDRILFSLQYLPDNYALSSSFGAQSAVSLHLLTQAYPDIPVVLIDTGYLFPETYQFIDQLTERLKLNLKVYQSEISNGWQEARFGKRWSKSVDDLQDYNQMNKVEPMERALAELNIGTWFAGLRRRQASTRANLPFIQLFKKRIKVHPLIDWTNQQLHHYLIKHKLPYHPLWEKGYVSIGDTHSSVPISAGMSEVQTRFNGRIRECGLHVEELNP